MSASISGAMFYEINRMTGWLFGSPTQFDITNYSDQVYLNNKYRDMVLLSADPGITPDTKSTDLLVAGLSVSENCMQKILTSQEYDTGNWFILGQGWLPIFAPPLNPDGQRVGRCIVKDSSKKLLPYNPLRLSIVLETLITFAKLAGIFGATYFASKMAYNYFRK